MRILISQRDVRIPPNNFLFDCLERSWYSFLGNHHLIPHGNIGKVDEKIEFDCLVLSGGSDSVARNITENNMFFHAIKLRKPILGVCHGAFAVNELTGGINDRLEQSLVEQHDNTTHEVTMDGKRYTVNSYHGQGITKLGKGMVPIATCDDGTIEAFRHEQLPIYGIVWHPERMENPVVPDVVANLLK